MPTYGAQQTEKTIETDETKHAVQSKETKNRIGGINAEKTIDAFVGLVVVVLAITRSMPSICRVCTGFFCCFFCCHDLSCFGVGHFCNAICTYV